ncbi:Mitochondrial carrier protein [Mycena indigotica]|uniref:Mitochondrial carrier protein n=1 Tax=Mycena indigotica TaxID=2126181 RepID=A0A8H6SLR0_9AGAR|nr:Mitochondrial carrier protein [Mycena indigotica]KAF7301731.1 Mitochondrial carrier protein [Mycena indigotica]
MSLQDDNADEVQTKREAPGAGEQDRPVARSLDEFRRAEGRENRKLKLKTLWQQLPKLYSTDAGPTNPQSAALQDTIDPETAQQLISAYEKELIRKCGGHSSGTAPIEWKEFRRYAEAKETELWHIFHDELDLDGNGKLDAQELRSALGKVGIKLSTAKLHEFMAYLATNPHSSSISFSQFRDFLLLLPQRASPSEIYRYYELRRYQDARGAARVNMEGDVSLSGEDRPTIQLKERSGSIAITQQQQQAPLHEDDGESHSWLEGHTALKFLLAGGIAGAVSRTCTAPFDRLKIFLITRPPDMGGATMTSKPGLGGARIIASAVARIYSEGGILAFWTGNGLSVAKIFPESAIKFFSYESSKRAFAKYWDHVEDSRDISGVSRFLSGGIGGITSQLSIYPIETLKTQMMSSARDPSMAQVSGTGTNVFRVRQSTMLVAARHLWALGGYRAYYRGLTIGLVGVFPYSAIDMSTFEALKLAYLRSTGKDEPGVLAILAFGSISGSVGATSVYPLNMVRTRLQASGSTGHPQTYTGPWDVAVKTWEHDGWRGFYRGLFPTLAKVVPAVSISYVVYEHSKRRLGV